MTNYKNYALAVVYSFLAVEILGYLWHRFGGHIGYFGDTVRITHYYHHEEVYPHTNLESDEYKTAYDHWPYFIPMTVVTSLIYYFIYKKYKLFDLTMFIIFMIFSLIYISITFYFHNSYHVKNHWLNKYEFYRKIKYQHFIHHFDNCNYGIIFNIVDKIFGTYCPVNVKKKKDIFNGFKSSCKDRLKLLDIIPLTV